MRIKDYVKEYEKNCLNCYYCKTKATLHLPKPEMQNQLVRVQKNFKTIMKRNINPLILNKRIHFTEVRCQKKMWRKFNENDEFFFRNFYTLRESNKRFKEAQKCPFFSTMED